MIFDSTNIVTTIKSSSRFWCAFINLNKVSVWPIEFVENIVAHLYNQFVGWTGISFFDPKMLTLGLWSVIKVNLHP